MTTFLALYRGRTVGEAKMVSVSADPALVNYVATKILGASDNEPSDDEVDPVLSAIEAGRKQALKLIAGSSTLR